MKPNPEDTAPDKQNALHSIHDDTASRTRSEAADWCKAIEGAVNNYLDREKHDKRNRLDHCDEKHHGCPCDRPTGTKKLVDLVILIDSSGSMNSAAQAIADAAEDAVKAAATECPSDLRVSWLTVDAAKPGASTTGYVGDITPYVGGTQFTQTHQQYLVSIGSTGPFEQDVPQPAGDPTYLGEEGADAIADICNFYDWRPGACKAVFYVSDTALDGLQQTPADVAASGNAKTVALAKGVVIFAHKIDPGSTSGAAVNQTYSDMCTPTGGSVYFGPVAVDKYKVLLKDAICRACGSECKEVVLPAIEPCVSIAWGDSDCDCFETDDVETAIVSVCNCYSNVAFANVHISYFYPTMLDGSPVPTLPDGTPSVEIIPIGPVCFGDIGPCREGETNCVSREIVIRTRGAKSGQYRINVGGICYEVVLKQLYNDCFILTLCAD